jgi:DNA-binding LytR/AlgR family response regulator
MKCLVVDDEPLARTLIESYIRQTDTLTLLKSCSNALEAFEILKHTSVDLIFLDIHMPHISGIQLLKSLKHKPNVILTTAYREHAAEAYDLDVVDYLLKPVTFDRFLRGVSKLYHANKSLALAAGTPLKSYDDSYIYFKEDREMVKVFLKDILYIESLRDYVRVKTPSKQIITYQKISFLEQKLPESKFIRIHRSFIVAIELVTSFSFNFVKLAEIEIPIGRNYKQQTLKVLNQNNQLMREGHQ